MTVQLSTRIAPKAKRILGELHKRTHIPIRALTEKAIFLLKERYDRMSQMYQGSVADERFMELLDYSITTHDATYRKLKHNSKKKAPKAKRPFREGPRRGWAEAFKEMHDNKEDRLIIPDRIDIDTREHWKW